MLIGDLLVFFCIHLFEKKNNLLYTPLDDSLHLDYLKLYHDVNCQVARSYYASILCYLIMNKALPLMLLSSLLLS